MTARRLAAIFASAVAGYSRLMDEHEAGTARAVAIATPPSRSSMTGLRQHAIGWFLAFARTPRAGKTNPSCAKSALEERVAKGPFCQPSFGCVST